MITQDSNARPKDNPWPCEQALKAWELTAECEMRAEHAADGALALISRGLSPESHIDELLESPLPLESGEPGFTEAGVPRTSRLDRAERVPYASAGERPSAVVPSSRSTRTANPNRTRRSPLFGGLGLALASAAALVFWLRPTPELGRVRDEPTVAGVAAAVSASAPAVTEVASTAPEPSVATLPERELESLAAKLAARTATTQPSRRGWRPATTQPEEVLLQASEKPLTTKPAMRPAEQGPNPIDRPSPGEIHASLARVLPGAGQCLGVPQRSVRVSVTFTSTGQVSSVIPKTPLTGAEQSCVVRAISLARVAPFARPNYRVDAMVHSHR